MKETASPWRWAAPLAYIAAIDGFAAWAFFSGTLDPDAADGAGGWPLAALAVLAVLAIAASAAVAAVSVARGGVVRRTFLRRAALAVKLGLIPFFILGGLVMAFLLLLSIHPVLAMAGWFAVPIAALVGWLVLLGGSVWPIAYAVSLRRASLVSTGECAVHVLLQLCFFADVADAIVLFARGRSREARMAGANGGIAAPHCPPMPGCGTGSAFDGSEKAR